PVRLTGGWQPTPGSSTALISSPPLTIKNCRYFWFQLRNYDVNDPAESEALTADFVSAFNEDLVVLAAVQKGLRSNPARMDLAADRGGNQARRILDKMIRAESLPIS